MQGENCEVLLFDVFVAVAVMNWGSVIPVAVNGNVPLPVALETELDPMKVFPSGLLLALV